jgi:hypothetical protein
MISFSVRKNTQNSIKKIPKVSKNLFLSLSKLKSLLLTVMMLSKELNN